MNEWFIATIVHQHHLYHFLLTLAAGLSQVAQLNVSRNFSVVDLPQHFIF